MRSAPLNLKSDLITPDKNKNKQTKKNNKKGRNEYIKTASLWDHHNQQTSYITSWDLRKDHNTTTANTHLDSISIKGFLRTRNTSGPV